MSQPPVEPQQFHECDSERTTSASPTSYSNDMEGGSPTPNMGTTTPLTHNSDPNDKRIFIRPIGIKTLEPYDGHRKIIESITRYFPEAFKTFRSAPQNEATIRKIYEKSAAKRLSDTLSQVRANLRDGKSPPKWMSDAVLAQYQTLWDNADFKRIFEKNKKNRNTDCGGMGPLLHTGGSIPMTEHRRRLKEKLGEEPSHAALFQATHKRKNIDNFVCKKAQHVMEIVTQKQQTQPELDQSIVWYEATGGLKKGGYVFGFGSDTPHYFPEVTTQKKSTYGGSSSHVACDERIGQLEKTKDEILEQNKIIIEFLRRAHPELLQSITHAVDSNQDSDIGLDNLNVNDDTQSPV
nr:putative transposase En/Spm [Ipomoea batatas]